MSLTPNTERVVKKKNPLKTNLALTAILVLIGAFAYWYEIKGPGKKKEEDTSTLGSKLVPKSEEREVESLNIVEREKKIEVEVTCHEHCKLSDPNGKWELKKPVIFSGDQGNIGSFITSLASIRMQEGIPLEGDAEARLKEYGLAKETRDFRKVIFKFKNDSSAYSIYLGDSSAVGENRYALVLGPQGSSYEKGDKVYLVPGYVYSNMQRPLSHWRNKKIFNFAATEVKSLILRNSKGETSIFRKDGKWLLSKSNQTADGETVDSFITGLIFVNAQGFASDNKVKDRTLLRIPAKPDYSLTLFIDKQKDPLVFDIFETFEKKGSSQRKIYGILSDKNFIVELDRSSIERFGKKPEDFREKSLLVGKELQKINQVHVSFNAGKEKLRFDLKQAQWTLTEGKIDQFEPTKVGEALDHITRTRIAGYQPKNFKLPAGFVEKSAWTFLGQGKKIKALTIYHSSAKGEYYAKLDSGEMTKLEPGNISLVPSALSGFKKAK